MKKGVTKELKRLCLQEGQLFTFVLTWVVLQTGKMSISPVIITLTPCLSRVAVYIIGLCHPTYHAYVSQKVSINCLCTSMIDGQHTIQNMQRVWISLSSISKHKKGVLFSPARQFRKKRTASQLFSECGANFKTSTYLPVNCPDGRSRKQVSLICA